MSRLKEADIRRIIRDENTRKERLENLAPEVDAVWEKIRGQEVPTKTGGSASVDTRSGDLEWRVVIDQVLTAYWEVVEEDLNDG